MLNGQQNNPLDPMGLFSESWPTSIVPFTVVLASFITSTGTLESISSDVFLFIPSDTSVDRVFIYPLGTVTNKGTANLTLSLVQGLPGGAVAEITDPVSLNGAEANADESIELLATDTLIVGRPVFLRMSGQEAVGSAASWYSSVILLGSVHFLASFKVEVEQTAQAPANQQLVNGVRQY